MLAIKDPFIRMAAHATLGSLSGIFIGLLLALLIAWLSKTLFSSTNSMTNDEFTRTTIPFLGMGAGAIIGGVLGGIVGIRKST